jgi:signal transduction histidine kinase
MSAEECRIFVCVTDGGLFHAIQEETLLRMPRVAIRSFVNVKQIYADLRQGSPAAIVLDAAVLSRNKIDEQIAELAELSPIILIGSAQDQPHIARLVAAGRADFVAQLAGFATLVAALLERIVRAAEAAEAARGMALRDLPEELLEFLRHEINNPLTGILGNAELLLAGRDHLPPASVQRLQTVVELAVRLRENVLRVTHQPKPARHAASN